MNETSSFQITSTAQHLAPLSQMANLGPWESPGTETFTNKIKGEFLFQIDKRKEDSAQS